MKKKLTTVVFRGTPEQEEKLIAAIDKYKGVKGAMMPILQEAQSIYGYLPIEVQKIVAQETGHTLEECYGITTFYSQFTLTPKGRHRISVCLGTACYVKGSQKVLDRLSEELGIPVGGTTRDGLFTLNATRCLHVEEL